MTHKKKRKLSSKMILPLVAFPFIALIMNWVALFKSMRQCAPLFKGDWNNFLMFSAATGMNSYFYKTRAFNLYKYGRSGRSPYIGLGNYPLKRTFHYSLPSLYSFWIAPNVTVLIGVLGMCLCFIPWMTSYPWSSVSYPVAALVISASVQYLIEKQNYNVLGWMFFPILLLGIHTIDYWVIGATLFVITFFSFTVYVIGAMVIIAYFIAFLEPMFLLVLIPGGVKLSLHLLPFLFDGEFSHVMNNVMKAIGMRKSSVKYRRTQLRLSQFEFYFMTWHFILAASILLYSFSYPTFLILGFGIFLFNKFVARFADTQTIYILMVCMAVTEVIVHFEFLYLIPLWFALNPNVLFDMKTTSSNKYYMPGLKPFRVDQLQQNLNDFLGPVPANHRVLFAFENPKGLFDNVFDGYRILVEPIHYVANKKSIHLLPDWWGLFEVNYEGAPDFWGRDLRTATHKMKEWDAEYLIVYQNHDKILEEQWEKGGFEILSELDWSDFDNDIVQSSYFELRLIPKWWLLKRTI